MDLVRCIAERFWGLDRVPVPKDLGKLRGIGDYGESVAAAYLKRRRFKILARNFEGAGAELDMIAAEFVGKQRVLCFIEVKSRVSAEKVRPEESVGRGKQRNIQRAAQCYWQRIHQPKVPMRFDIIEVLLSPGEQPEVHLIRDAFPGDEDWY